MPPVPKSKQPVPNGQDVSHWLTREQACDLLGVSYSTILRSERRGLLHPQARRNDDTGQPVLVYEPAELAKVPRRRMFVPADDPGELAARVFQMLDRGRSLREIVIECRITFTRADELREQWCEAGGCDLGLPYAIAAELEAVLGAFRSPAELLERVRTRLCALAPANTEVTP